MLNITGLDGPHFSRRSNMAETEYIVLKGQKYVGRHKVYKESEKFPGSELFGNEDNIEMALKGGGPNKAKPRIKVVSHGSKPSIEVAPRGSKPKIEVASRASEPDKKNRRDNRGKDKDK